MVSEADNDAYEFYNNILGKPKYILAPMVEQSELAFRLLCQDHKVQLRYTPMWHAGIFVKDPEYRKAALQTCPEDRPLIVQFCANDPQTFADACALAEPYCDGVDLNLGCPQIIARRGHYGAFLMDEWELVENLIRTASERIVKPVTAKIRIFPEIGKTVEYAKRIEKAGAKIITVHGRLREQRGPLTGIADWDHIKAVKENVSVPVFANGNIQHLRDVERCLEYTKVDGVMSAEGALYNPALFTGRQPPAWEMVDEYLSYAYKYRPPLGYIRGHLFRLWHHCLCKHDHLRTPMGLAKTYESLIAVSEQIKKIVMQDAERDKSEGRDCEEPGSLPYWRCQPYVRPPQKNSGKRTHEESDGSKNKEDKPLTTKKLKQIKKHLHGKGLFPKISRDKWPLCKGCLVNPWGSRCDHNRCRKCCKEKTALETLDCPGHKLWFLSNSIKAQNPAESQNGKIKMTSSEPKALNIQPTKLSENTVNNCNNMKKEDESILNNIPMIVITSENSDSVKFNPHTGGVSQYNVANEAVS